MTTIDNIMALHNAASHAAVQYALLAQVSLRSERSMQALEDRNEANEALRAALAQQAEQESDDYMRGFHEGMKEAPTGECWIRAIDEAMVGAHIGVANIGDDYGTAKEKLNNLICWSVEVDRELSKPAQQAEQGWVLLNDGLPQPHQLDGEDDDSLATHWMPLPTPPKEKKMKAQTIINRAARAAANHVGALEAEVQSLCKELAQFKPVQSGTETTFSYASCDLVVFYESDSEGDFDILDIYANGMSVHEVLSEDVMDLIREHVTDHAYMLRKQAEYDRGEDQYERRRDAELEG